MPIKVCSPAAAPRRSTRRAATLSRRPRPRPARCSSSARNGCPIRHSHAFKARFGEGKVTYVSGDDPSAAAAAAKSADVAIVFGYQWESEGMDLKTLALSDDQNKLIEAVAAANPKTIVVLETGSPALMPWVDKVSGVIEAWYPGIRGSEALANIVSGDVNPTGKLAITFPKSDADLPHPTIVMPPPESQPHRPAPGPEHLRLHGADAEGPARLPDHLR